jgi:hypothetical protein
MEKVDNMHGQMGCFSWELEVLDRKRKPQQETHTLSSRLHKVEERTREAKDPRVGIPQTETQKKRVRKQTDPSRAAGQLRMSNIMWMRTQKAGKMGQEKYLKRQWSRIFPKS